MLFVLSLKVHGGTLKCIINYALYLAHYVIYFYINDDAILS